MRSLVRFVKPAVPHDSVHFQRTLGWVLHPLSVTQVVKQLLCGQARVGGTSKSKCLPQQDAKRPSGNVKKYIYTSNISNTEKMIENTTRSAYFSRTLRSFEMWSNTDLSIQIVFSIDTKAKEQTEK